jgi:hypothetical protein
VHADIGNKVALAFPRAIRYPTDPPFGPSPRAHSFRRADQAAWRAWSEVVAGHVDAAKLQLDSAYRCFAKSAERHVAHVTARPEDDNVKVGGFWGSVPRPRWQKVHVQPPPPPLDLLEQDPSCP